MYDYWRIYLTNDDIHSTAHDMRYLLSWRWAGVCVQGIVMSWDAGFVSRHLKEDWWLCGSAVEGVCIQRQLLHSEVETVME